MKETKHTPVATRDLIEIIRAHKTSFPAFNAVLESAATRIEDFLGGPVEHDESTAPPKPGPAYVTAGCAIDTADDWKDGRNRGGKIVASTALNLIDEDHEDDMPENAETEFAETIANALTLLCENQRLREALAICAAYIPSCDETIPKPIWELIEHRQLVARRALEAKG